MKKIWHSMLCGGALAALLCTPALAAGEKIGRAHV